MLTKKCFILSKSSTLGTVFQWYGYETIVFSETPAFLAVLNTMPADLVVIDDVDNGRSLLTNILALPKIPEKITIRDDIDDASLDQKRVIHVKTQTTESVWWEIIQLDNTSQEQPLELPPGQKKDRILVIDDVAELVDMYKIMFETKWYEVETASDGLEGITKAVSFQPKYILLDIMMPNMDGFALMKTFRENTSLNSVIIVNSNIDGTNITEKIYAAGADYYIRKSDYVPTQIVYMIEQGMFMNKRNVMPPQKTT